VGTQGLTYPQNGSCDEIPIFWLRRSTESQQFCAKSLISLNSPTAAKVGNPARSQTNQGFSAAAGSLPTKLSTDCVESFENRSESAT
jgi:hypothetical protein